MEFLFIFEGLALRQYNHQIDSAHAMADFGPGMIDEKEARFWIMRRLHPSGLWCPGCDSDDFSMERTATWFAGGRVMCKHCGRWFNSRTGTRLEGCCLGWREVYLLLVLTELGLSRQEIATRMGVHPDTIGRTLKRLEVGR